MHGNLEAVVAPADKPSSDKRTLDKQEVAESAASEDAGSFSRAVNTTVSKQQKSAKNADRVQEYPILEKTRGRNLYPKSVSRHSFISPVYGDA